MKLTKFHGATFPVRYGDFQSAMKRASSGLRGTLDEFRERCRHNTFDSLRPARSGGIERKPGSSVRKRDHHLPSVLMKQSAMQVTDMPKVMQVAL
jgi:hypothetical protein